MGNDVIFLHRISAYLVPDEQLGHAAVTIVHQLQVLGGLGNSMSGCAGELVLQRRDSLSAQRNRQAHMYLQGKQVPLVIMSDDARSTNAFIHSVGVI
jgi:hypothetical protein